MRTLAAWIRFPVAGIAVCGGILLAIMMGLMVFIPEEIGLLSIIFAIILLIFVILIWKRVRINRRKTAPIWGKGKKIYLNNGRCIRELSCRNVFDAYGKNKKFFRSYDTYTVRGTYNYGKVVVRYFNSKGRMRKFVIRNIYNPEDVAWNIMRYVEFHSLKWTEKIKGVFG